MPSSDFASAIGQGLQFKQQRELQNQKIQSNFLNLERERQKLIFDHARVANALVKNNQPELAYKFLSDRANIISQSGGDPSDTMEPLNMLAQGDINGVINLLDSVEQAGIAGGFIEDLEAKKQKEKGADLKTFESLLEKAGLSKEDSEKAARIKLGLDPRATGSADITIAQKDMAKEVAAVKSELKEAEKFGELTGSSRANAIDKGFEKVGKINSNISNINRAITLLEQGAKTGAVERFLPSVKAATVELNNLRSQLGLDVIGSVTFGALSEGELNLALDTALPTGLNEPELKDWLQRKRGAQEKLRGYIEEQINFLDQGGTKAGFIRQMKRQQSSQPQQRTEQEILSQYGIG